MDKHLLLLLLILMSFPLQSQEFIPAQEVQSLPNSIARIEVHTASELNGLLLRAESLFDSGALKPGIDAPVAFILHGAEAKLLLTENYQANKSLVDLAARLSAFKVVDIKVCKTWMGGEGIKESQLPPFIATVLFGVEEERRLMQQQNYVYF